MAKPKTCINTTIDRIVDGLTGELLSETITEGVEHVGQVSSEPDFVKLYLNRIAKIQGLNNSQSNVLFEIIKMMPFADNAIQLIVLNAYIKSQIADKLKVSKQYISDVIAQLTKEGLLINCKSLTNPKSRTGAYTVNSLYIAKGKWIDIKNLQLQVSFDEKHGEVIESVSIENKDGTTETIIAGVKPKKNTLKLVQNT